MAFESSLKVLANKHASLTSTICQMADIGRQFTILKAKTKSTTAVNLPSGYGLKGQLEDELDRLNASGVLMLKTPAHKAIIDHVVTCPEIYGSAMKPKTTKKEYIKNGIRKSILKME